ncbi:MAG: hypothetical protein VCD66_15160 [Alphaproteobacteria bacterium]
MPYVEGRVIHDADSHLMELDDCLDPYLSKALLERFHRTEAFQGRIAKRRDIKAQARATRPIRSFAPGPGTM